MRTLTAFTICCLTLTITLNTNAEDADAGVVEPRPISGDAVRVNDEADAPGIRFH